MKNALLILLTAATLALGAVCVVQWHKRDAQQAELTSLRGEFIQKTRELAELQAAQALLDRQRREARQQAGDLAAKLQEQRLVNATLAARTAAASSDDANRQPAKTQGGFGEFLSKMMEDPEMRKMIRQTHRAMLNQLYDPLIRRMGLTPEEAEQFKELLADNMMKGAEKASSLFGGGLTNRAEMFKTAAAEQKAFDEQLRQFLGETRYAQYKDYQETVGERAQLNQFRQQTGGENALTDQQTEQLLAFMSEEKKAVAATTGQAFPGTGQDAATWEAMFSDESVQKLMQAQEAVNQRVYERARGVLSENQLGAFGKFQTNQLQMMRLGMSMARKFMAPGESGASTGPTP
jgi:uncharacterized protein YciI